MRKFFKACANKTFIYTTEQITKLLYDNTNIIIDILHKPIFIDLEETKENLKKIKEN